MPTDIQTSGELALAFEPSGYEQIPGSTILTRLNYFDGKFLRADALRVEQGYLRRLAELGARAGGAGLVYGFDVSLDDGELVTIGGGLGFDAAGRVLYLPDAFSVGLQELIDRTSAAYGQSFAPSEGSSGFSVCEPETPTAPTTPAGAEFYLITIAHAEDACGEEDVFGKLCDDGCATSTDRAYLVEGVIARATPYIPKTPFASCKAVQLTAKHVRSQLASAAFADERLVVSSLISKAGLASGAWCTGAPAPTGWEVPIAVVGRLAAGNFVDEWIVRRERMDGPPRSFWAWSMAMRPWQAFLAQVLQFQCQLPSALTGRGGEATDVDPCKPQTQLLGEMAAYVQDLELAFAGAPAEVAPMDVEVATPIEPIGGLQRIQGLHEKLKAVLAAARAPSRRILIDGGILELPPAGYLPVTPGTTPPVEEQVRRLLGDGVDLRFCVVSPDYVPRALESAQHMERISLVQGLDDAKSRPKVDLLVPAGQLTAPPATKARGWDTSLVLTGSLVGGLAGARAQAVGIAAEATNLAFLLHGVGRSAPLEPGGRFDFAGERETQPPQLATLGTHLDFSAPLSQPAGATVDAAEEGPRLGTYLAVECPVDPWTLAVGQDVTLTAEGAFGMTAAETPFGGAATATGYFTVEEREGLPGGGVRVRALGTLAAQGHTVGSNANSGSGSLGVRVDLRVDTGATPPTFEATVTSSEEGKSGEILLWARWQGEPLEVDGALGLEDPTGGTSVPAPAGVTITDGPSFTRPLALAHLIADDGVFTPGDPLRSKATDALETLASVLDDARYTGAIESRLFDPSAENGGEGVLTATLDWVLFQRRRERACGPPTAPPAVTTAKELVLFVDRERAKQVSTLLQAGNVAAALQLGDEVGDAEFVEATATLVTPASALKQSWDAMAGGPPNAAGVVGLAPLDTTLLRSRALAVGAACGGQFTLVQLIAVNALPFGYDAAIFLRGPAKLAAVVYHVYGAWEGDAIAELSKNNDVDAFITREEVRNAGTISFEAGTSTVGGVNLQPFSELFEATPDVAAAWVFVRPTESTDEPTDAQVDQIVAQGGGAKDPEYQLVSAASTTDAAWPADATLVCVLSIRPKHQ
jgi:hypothetical protein